LLLYGSLSRLMISVLFIIMLLLEFLRVITYR
jgi:hypothetical protein